MKNTFEKLELGLYQAELMGVIYRIQKYKGAWMVTKANRGKWDVITTEKTKLECEIASLKDAIK